jgi:hypothetical protein
MKRFWLALGLLLCGVGGAVGQGVSLPIVLQPVTSTVPSIDLNFLASTTALPPGVVFSRASSRSCTDNTGTIVTVTTNNPCLDYNPSTLAYIGLSVEAAATNSLVQSGAMQTTWANNCAPATANAGTAPDSSNTAILVTDGCVAPNSYYYQSIAGTNGTVYNFSVFAKAGATNWVELVPADFAGSGLYAWFNVSTCAVGSSSGYGSQPPTGAILLAQAFPNGWCRISVSVTWASTSGNAGVVLIPTSANSVGAAIGNAAYFWGAQRELGYAPTSYIPTTTVAATRAGEVAYLPVTGIRGVNGSAGTMFAQMTYEAPCPNTGGCYARWLAFNDGNNPNAGTEWGFSTGTAYPTLGGNIVTANAVSGGATNVVTSAVAGNSYRYAMSFNPNTVPNAANSVTAPNDVTGSVPRTLTVLNLNQPQRYQPQASLWFQRVTYIPAFMGAAWVTGKANGSIP